MKNAFPTKSVECLFAGLVPESDWAGQLRPSRSVLLIDRFVQRHFVVAPLRDAPLDWSGENTLG